MHEATGAAAYAASAFAANGPTTPKPGPGETPCCGASACCRWATLTCKWIEAWHIPPGTGAEEEGKGEGEGGRAEGGRGEND